MRKYMKFKAVKKLNPISTMKIFIKPAATYVWRNVY